MARHVGRDIGVGPQLARRPSPGERTALRLDPERDGLGRMLQGFVERIAGGEAAGEVGEPDADRMVGTGVL